MGVGQRLAALPLGKTSLENPNFEGGQAFQEFRIHEKEDIKGLNNHFAHFIDKMRTLEQCNKQLEMHWKLLQEKGVRSSNIDSLFQVYFNNLMQQIDALAQEKIRLVEDYKTKYEDEIK